MINTQMCSTTVFVEGAVLVLEDIGQLLSASFKCHTHGERPQHYQSVQMIFDLYMINFMAIQFWSPHFATSWLFACVQAAGGYSNKVISGFHRFIFGRYSEATKDK